MQLRTIAIVIPLALAPWLAQAGTFNYDVNFSFGSFSVTGTITTDTNSGALATSDILDWNLQLNDFTNTLDLLGPLSGNNSQTGIFGSDAVASPADITWNFDDTGFSAWAFEDPALHSSGSFLCYQSQAGGCNDFIGAHIAIEVLPDGTETQIESGTQVIATAASPTPEPSSLVLFGSGILCAIGMAWRTRKS